jgi:MerR family transcriptional regulator/heat shock protein HspR
MTFIKNKDMPLYGISVVSEMLGVHPQTLRLYEREGFVCPSRHNKQRKYSECDVEKLGMVVKLTREMGVNKAGVEIILRMSQRIDALHGELQDMLMHIEEETRNDFIHRIRKIFSEDR